MEPDHVRWRMARSLRKLRTSTEDVYHVTSNMKAVSAIASQFDCRLHFKATITISYTMRCNAMVSVPPSKTPKMQCTRFQNLDQYRSCR